MRIREDVDPRRRRDATGGEPDYILTPVGTEAAQPVVEDQRLAFRCPLRQSRRRQRAGRGEQGDARLCRTMMVELLRQRSPAVGDHRAGNRFEQAPVFARDLLGWPYEDAPWPVDHARPDVRGDQAHDLLLQLLPVAGVVFVPDHQVDHQAFQAPVRMGLHQLPDQVDVGGIHDLQQHDRQIAGNGIAPQAGLSAPILHQHRWLATKPAIGMDDHAGQSGIELRVGLAGIELLQDHLAVSPGQLEDTIRKMPVPVFLDQADGHIPALGHPRDDIDGDRLVGFEHDTIANGHDRIEHRAVAARKPCLIGHRLRRDRASRSTDEACAIGFEGHLAARRAMHHHQVEHPRRPLTH